MAESPKESDIRASANLLRRINKDIRKLYTNLFTIEREPGKLSFDKFGDPVVVPPRQDRLALERIVRQRLKKAGSLQTRITNSLSDLSKELSEIKLKAPIGQAEADKFVAKAAKHDRLVSLKSNVMARMVSKLGDLKGEVSPENAKTSRKIAELFTRRNKVSSFLVKSMRLGVAAGAIDMILASLAEAGVTDEFIIDELSAPAKKEGPFDFGQFGEKKEPVRVENRPPDPEAFKPRPKGEAARFESRNLGRITKRSGFSEGIENKGGKILRTGFDAAMWTFDLFNRTFHAYIRTLEDQGGIDPKTGKERAAVETFRIGEDLLGDWHLNVANPFSGENYKKFARYWDSEESRQMRFHNLRSMEWFGRMMWTAHQLGEKMISYPGVKLLGKESAKLGANVMYPGMHALFGTPFGSDFKEQAVKEWARFMDAKHLEEQGIEDETLDAAQLAKQMVKPSFEGGLLAGLTGMPGMSPLVMTKYIWTQPEHLNMLKAVYNSEDYYDFARDKGDMWIDIPAQALIDTINPMFMGFGALIRLPIALSTSRQLRRFQKGMKYDEVWKLLEEGFEQAALDPSVANIVTDYLEHGSPESIAAARDFVTKLGFQGRSIYSDFRDGTKWFRQSGKGHSTEATEIANSQLERKAQHMRLWKAKVIHDEAFKQAMLKLDTPERMLEFSYIMQFDGGLDEYARLVNKGDAQPLDQVVIEARESFEAVADWSWRESAKMRGEGDLALEKVHEILLKASKRLGVDLTVDLTADAKSILAKRSGLKVKLNLRRKRLERQELGLMDARKGRTNDAESLLKDFESARESQIRKTAVALRDEKAKRVVELANSRFEVKEQKAALKVLLKERNRLDHQVDLKRVVGGKGKTKQRQKFDRVVAMRDKVKLEIKDTLKKISDHEGLLANLTAGGRLKGGVGGSKISSNITTLEAKMKALVGRQPSEPINKSIDQAKHALEQAKKGETHIDKLEKQAKHLDELKTELAEKQTVIQSLEEQTTNIASKATHQQNRGQFLTNAERKRYADEIGALRNTQTKAKESILELEGRIANGEEVMKAGPRVLDDVGREQNLAKVRKDIADTDRRLKDITIAEEVLPTGAREQAVHGELAREVVLEGDRKVARGIVRPTTGQKLEDLPFESFERQGQESLKGGAQPERLRDLRTGRAITGLSADEHEQIMRVLRPQAPWREHLTVILQSQLEGAARRGDLAPELAGRVLKGAKKLQRSGKPGRVVMKPRLGRADMWRKTRDRPIPEDIFVTQNLKDIRATYIATMSEITSRPANEAASTTLRNFITKSQKALDGHLARAMGDYTDPAMRGRLIEQYQGMVAEGEKLLLAPEQQQNAAMRGIDVAVRSMKQGWLFYSPGWYIQNFVDNTTKNALVMGGMDWTKWQTKLTPFHGDEPLNFLAGFKGIADEAAGMFGQPGSSIELIKAKKFGQGVPFLGGKKIPGTGRITGLPIAQSQENMVELIEATTRNHIGSWVYHNEIDRLIKEFGKSPALRGKGVKGWDAATRKSIHERALSKAMGVVSDTQFFSENLGWFSKWIDRLVPFSMTFTVPNTMFWIKQGAKHPALAGSLMRLREISKESSLDGRAWLRIPGSDIAIDPASFASFEKVLQKMDHTSDPSDYTEEEGPIYRALLSLGSGIAAHLPGHDGVPPHLKLAYEALTFSLSGMIEDPEQFGTRSERKQFFYDTMSVLPPIDDYSKAMTGKSLLQLFGRVGSIEHEVWDSYDWNVEAERRIEYLAHLRELKEEFSGEMDPAQDLRVREQAGMHIAKLDHADPLWAEVRWLKRARAEGWGQLIGVKTKYDPGGMRGIYLNQLDRVNSASTQDEYNREMKFDGQIHMPSRKNIALGPEGTTWDAMTTEQQRAWPPEARMLNTEVYDAYKQAAKPFHYNDGHKDERAKFRGASNAGKVQMLRDALDRDNLKGNDFMMRHQDEMRQLGDDTYRDATTELPENPTPAQQGKQIESRDTFEDYRRIIRKREGF